MDVDDAAGAEQEVAVQRQRRGDGTAKVEDEHRLLEEAAVATVDWEGGNSGAGLLSDIFFHLH